MDSVLTTIGGRLTHSPWLVPVAGLLALGLVATSEYTHRAASSALDRTVDAARARRDLLTVGQRLALAESSQRAYLLTGRSEYLPALRDLHAETHAALLRLRAHVDAAGKPAAADALARLTELWRSKLEVMQRSMELFGSGREEDARAVIATQLGPQLLLETRDLSATLDTLYNEEVTQGLSHAYGALRQQRIGVMVLTSLSLLLLALFAWQSALLQRQHAREVEHQADERQRLETEVNHRTAELRELARHLQSAREDERARLARELHDELGALLTAAKLDVARIKPKLQAPELLERLQHLTETLNGGIALKRRIIEDLRPSALSNLGLVPALQSLCQDHRQRAGIAVEIDLEEVALDDDSQLTVYRLVQEALTNASKHAHATRIDVRLRAADKDRVLVEVQDNGAGFEQRALRGNTHGLMGMRFRVESAGGTFSVRSRPGQGTTIAAELASAERAAPVAL